MTTPRLLVIDDDDMVLTYLSRTLSHRYTIMTRQDPKAAIELAAVELPDLILCDIDMPDMDGGAGGAEKGRFVHFDGDDCLRFRG